MSFANVSFDVSSEVKEIIKKRLDELRMDLVSVVRKLECNYEEYRVLAKKKEPMVFSRPYVVYTSCYVSPLTETVDVNYGHYDKTLEAANILLIEGISTSYYKRTVSYDRVVEIATLLKDKLVDMAEGGQYIDMFEFKEMADLSSEEEEFFGFEELWKALDDDCDEDEEDEEEDDEDEYVPLF